MYKLVREKKELRLVKEKDPTLYGPPPGNTAGFQIYAPAWRGCTPQEKRLWKEFISQGKVDSSLVPAPILESWQRCFLAEVEYAGGRCQDILSAGELAKRQSRLLDVAAPALETLHHCLRGFGFVVVLIDQDGYILKSIGDRESLSRAERINFGPGANWSELSVGTNAIGTALALGQPIQVTGPEHYNDGHHVWTCAATPICDPGGRMVGCLDISGPRENAGFNILDMTLAAVRFIEDQLRLEQAHQHLLNNNRLLATAINSVSDGIISLNFNGIIEKVNNSAARLLGLAPGELVGRQIETTPLAISFSNSGPFSGRREMVTLETGSGHLDCLMSTTAIKDNYGCPVGSVITLSEAPQARTARRINHGFKARYTFNAVIGQSPALLEAVEKAKMAAAGSSTIVILGESGVGKEVFAQAIHQASPRKQAPFISINCGAIPKELIQSELFGYSEGAFTGARKGGRRGKLELANGGTVFLDEIADMPLDMQTNLLRFLEEKTFLPVGHDKMIGADVRVIAATNRNLELAVARGRFREDLYYRLNVVVIRIPPLKERGRDIHLLTEHHIQRLAVKMGKTIKRVHPDIHKIMAGHHWPGNVRELINVLEQAINFMPGQELTPRHLPAYLRRPAALRPLEQIDEIIPLSTLEKYAIEHALKHCRGNLSQAARALGIGRNTLYSKIKKYGICHPLSKKEPLTGN